MPRTQYKVYRTHRRRRRFSLLIVVAAAVVLAAGMRTRYDSGRAVTAEALTAPTATPVTPLFDETPAERDFTLPSSTWYALQTGLYTDEASALQVAGMLTDRGAPGYILSQNGKFRVLIACYGEQAEADAMRARLSQHQAVETIVYRWTCEPVTLRLSGMAGQLDAVEAGLTLLFQTAPEMRDLAVAADRGEYTADEIQAMLASLLAQLDLWDDTVRSRFAMPHPAIVTESLTLCADVREAVAGVQKASTVTDLSAALKLQSMALYKRLNDFRMFLSGL